MIALKIVGLARAFILLALIVFAWFIDDGNPNDEDSATDPDHDI